MLVCVECMMVPFEFWMTIGKIADFALHIILLHGMKWLVHLLLAIASMLGGSAAVALTEARLLATWAGGFPLSYLAVLLHWPATMRSLPPM